MMIVNDCIQIPAGELHWSFARAGGPGGQNVNKVASKALLRWDLARSPSVPEEVKSRLRSQQRRRVTSDGQLVLVSQRFREQERNRQDCLDKLWSMIRQAAVAPKPRRATRPSRASRERKLRSKRVRAQIKAGRRPPQEE